LNVTDTEKIYIASSQAAVLEVSSFRTCTRSMSFNILVKNRLFKAACLHGWAAVSIHPHDGSVGGRHDAA